MISVNANESELSLVMERDPVPSRPVPGKAIFFPSRPVPKAFLSFPEFPGTTPSRPGNCLSRPGFHM